MTWDSGLQKHNPSEWRGVREPPCREAQHKGFGARQQDGVSPSLEPGVWREERWEQSALYHGSKTQGAREHFGSGSGFEDGDVPALLAPATGTAVEISATHMVVSCRVSGACVALPALLSPFSAGGSRILQHRAPAALAPPPPGTGGKESSR